MKLVTPACIAGHSASLEAVEAALPGLERAVDAAVAQLIAVSDAGKAWVRRAEALRDIPGFPISVVSSIESYLPTQEEQTRVIERSHRRIIRLALIGIARLVSEARGVAWTASLNSAVYESVEDSIPEFWPDVADHLSDDDNVGSMLLVKHMAAVNSLLDVALQPVVGAGAGPKPGETLAKIREFDEFARNPVREPRMVGGCYELTMAARLRNSTRPSYCMAAGDRMSALVQALLAPYYHAQCRVMPVQEIESAAKVLDRPFDLGDEVMLPAGVKLILRKSAIKVRVPPAVMEQLLLLVGDGLEQKAD